ncbi:MAG: glycosyltransferase [Armatimonadota bacterium]|nr:glycosyltransferase [Armatimonadota bacterium]
MEDEIEALRSGAGDAPRATVVVCTRERPQDLARCLDSVMRQRSPFGFETLVVDNCPATDRSALVVNSHHGSVRYAREPRRGLDFARNRGVSEAASPFVAFMDDDVVADRDWLVNLLAPFEDPQIACVTGLNKPLEMETEAQRIFEKFQSLGRGEQARVYDRNWGGTFFPLGSGVVGAGCNAAFRKSVLLETGLFEESLDVGTPSRGGGDLYAFYRVARAGYKIAYQPSAVAYHRHRRAMAELRKTMFDYGLGHNAYQTRCLLTDRDPAALVFPAFWLFRYHLRELARSVVGRSGFPAALALAQTAGYLLGPAAYVWSVAAISRRRAQREAN